jgi:hypothetical protein
LPFNLVFSFTSGSILLILEDIGILGSLFGVGGLEIDGVEFSPKKINKNCNII